MNLFVLVFFDLLSFFVDDISCLKRKGEVKIKQFHPENERVITLSKNILPNKSKMGNVKFFEHQKKQIISEVRRYNMEEGFVVKIKAIIKGEITKGIKPKIQFVADKLGVSSKTLSRKLKSYDTNFQTCVDSVIYDATLELIKQGLTTKEIAYSLGFNSIAGLNYLFSKKTGMTIMQYKEASLRLNKLV